jgi:flagellar basal-body rod protein FlgG
MIRSLFTSATGLAAQQTVIDNTANNLANVNTSGFKKNLVNFQDLVYVSERSPGADAFQGQPVPSGLQIGTGVRVVGNTKIYTQGSEVNTGNPLNVAIDGDGFFQIQLPSGETRYTRDGAFQTNATGTLVNGDGFPVQPPVTIPPTATSVSIGNDGTISITNAGTTTSTPLGQLQLVRFPNPGGLSAQGRNLLAQTDSSGAPTSSTPGQQGIGLVRGGFLEQSNVDVVGELVSLIMAQRSYEFNLRSIKAADEMLLATTQIVT